MPFKRNIIRNKKWRRVVDDTNYFIIYNFKFHKFLFEEYPGFFNAREDLYNESRKLLLELDILLHKLEDFPDNYAKKFMAFYNGEVKEVEEDFSIIDEIEKTQKNVYILDAKFTEEFNSSLDFIPDYIKTTVLTLFSFYKGSFIILKGHYRAARDEFIRNKAYDEDLEFLETWPSDDESTISESEEKFKISYKNSIWRRRKRNYQPNRSYFEPIKYGWD